MGVPKRRVGPSARVVINVIRNQHPPQFRGEPFKKQILQTMKTGSQVLQVQADDKDSKVHKFSPVPACCQKYACVCLDKNNAVVQKQYNYFICVYPLMPPAKALHSPVS